MVKQIKIKSTFLSPLNEALQKLKLNDTVANFTPVIVEADGKFTSIVNTKEEFNPNDLGSSFETEEIETEEQKETKEQLLNKAKDALKQTLTNSKELNDILQKIQDLSKETSYNTWELNKEQNTASLKSKNAMIFKQNNNLCLAHNGKIELFKSVDELRNWLKEKGYPLPGNNIIIHEAVEVKEDGRNWLNLLNDYNDKKKAEYTPINSNKTYPDLLNQALGKKVDKQLIQASNRARPKIKLNRSYLQKDIEQDNKEVEECGVGCVSTVALGPAVAYTASSKKKEEEVKEDLQEGKSSLIPNDLKIYPGNREAVNAFLTWYKRNKPSIEGGKIKLPSDFENTFDTIIEPTFLNNDSDSVSRIWLKLIEKRILPLANKISDTKKISLNNVLEKLLSNPNQKVCELLSQELNSYIPNEDKYNFGKVNLIPNVSIIATNKDNPNYQQRKNWQKALYLGKLDGKVDLNMVNLEKAIEVFNDLKNFVKKPKIAASEYTLEELELIKKYNLANIKTESNIFESAKNYPWLNKILGQRLTEDDSPADFATDSPISSDMGNTDTASTSTTSTSTSTNTSNIPDIDIGDNEAPTNSSFGDINIDAGGYSPEDTNIEVPNQIDLPDYKIIDVLMNDDNNDIKVKVQNQDTKKTEIKDLEDIDV